MKSEWSFKKNDTQCSGTKEGENLKKSKKKPSLHGPMVQSVVDFFSICNGSLKTTNTYRLRYSKLENLYL